MKAGKMKSQGGEARSNLTRLSECRKNGNYKKIVMKSCGLLAFSVESILTKIMILLFCAENFVVNLEFKWSPLSKIMIQLFRGLQRLLMESISAEIIILPFEQK